MKRRHPAILTIGAVAATVALAACSPTPTVDPTSSPTTTATPTPTAGAIPTQEPVPVPMDQASAIAGANAAYEGYLAALLDLLADPSLGAAYVSAYILPGTPAAQEIDDTIRSNTESGLRASGGPFEWQLNEAMSYAAPATDTTTGERNDVGSVQLFGCSDNTKVNFTSPDIPKGSAPFNATLVYVTAQQSWMLQNSDQLRPGNQEVPQC